MTTVAFAPELRLRSPEDVLAAIPYLLGFHPSDSIVVLGLRDKRLTFHARGDLPPGDAPTGSVEGFAAHLGNLFRANDVSAVVLVGYGEPDRVTPTMLAVRRAMRRHRIGVREMLRTAGGLFWSYLCPDRGCCPPEGRPFDVAGSAVAATAIVAGCVALPDREAVLRSFDPPTGSALAAIEEATGRSTARFQELRDGAEATTVARAGVLSVSEAFQVYERGASLPDDELAWLTLLLQVRAVRDAAWSRVDADGREHWDTHERLWTDVLRRCRPDLAAAPGVLLSYTLWRCGEGLRAAVAADRALAADPTCSAARVMAQVLEQGVPPSALDRLPSPRGARLRAAVRGRRRRRR